MSATTESLFRGTIADLPARIDVAAQIAPEHYALERERIWRRAWLAIGHTQDLPAKGSYFVYDIPTFSMSLLVVRGQDDRVRVFHNICRHRGNKLERGGAGCKSHFTCNFHGWVFNNDGALRLITDEKEFEDCDKSALGLIPVHSAVWNTMIFINLAEEPHCSLAEWLGDLHGQYDGYFEEREKVAAFKAVVHANWHLAVNAFTEGYHTLYLHKSTARDYQGGRTNPERHRPHIEILERHHRYSAPGNPDKVFVRGEKVAAKYGRLMIPAFDFDSSALPPGVNAARHDKWAFDVVEFFPNLVMLQGNCWQNEITYWPIDAGRTLILNQAWAYKAKNLGERLSRSYFRARVRDVFREDLNTLEAQQAALSTGAMREVVLSRQEMALRHHYKVSARMLGGEL
ncbi:MAG: aromatic ring-hydroxylating dioxygenase subunit alpha [Burkholderiales bacterium]|nr:aromatic ring-hydroxylating dioxygenase subunit alpha [Burkholderiales bacterium]